MTRTHIVRTHLRNMRHTRTSHQILYRICTNTINIFHVTILYKIWNFRMRFFIMDQSLGGEQVVSADSSKKMAFVSVRLQNQS